MKYRFANPEERLKGVFESGFSALDIPSRRKGLERVRRIESLRNNLAHSQGIVSQDWPTIVGIARELDATLALLRGPNEESER